MNRITKFLSAALACIGLAAPATAVPIANSVTEYSGVQGQDAWSYGFFNLTAKGGAYTTGDFVAFDTFDAGTWRASDGQTGSNNNDFLSINSIGGHPNGLGPSPQDASIWAIRRYTSEVSGLVKIDFDLHKVNIFNSGGGGITGHLFVDGIEVFNALIGNTDDIGIQSSIFATVNVGSLIDFAIDPVGNLPLTGNDGVGSARADGSHFSAIIGTGEVPEPGSALLMGAALLVLVASRRTARAD